MQDTNEVPRDQAAIRTASAADLDAIVAIDAAAAGRRRERFLATKLTQALADTGIAMSLVAELDGHVVGFLLARVYYGEFGVLEPSAVMDVLGVHPDYRGRHVAAALVDQLRTNLLGLGISTLQTQVRWDNPDLIAFFQHEGFGVAQRICLDLDLVRTRT